MCFAIIIIMTKSQAQHYMVNMTPISSRGHASCFPSASYLWRSHRRKLYNLYDLRGSGPGPRVSTINLAPSVSQDPSAPHSAFVLFPRHSLVSTEPSLSCRVWPWFWLSPVAQTFRSHPHSINIHAHSDLFIHSKYLRTCTPTWLSLSLPSPHLVFSLHCLPQFGTGTEIYLLSLEAGPSW
jgi:hypothetical protein